MDKILVASIELIVEMKTFNMGLKSASTLHITGKRATLKF